MMKIWELVKEFYRSGFVDLFCVLVFSFLSLTHFFFSGDTEKGILYMIAATVVSISSRMVERKR